MRKRQKFVVTAVLLAVGLWGVQLSPLEWRYGLIVLLAATAWVMSAWSLREGLGGIEWLTVLLPQVLFTAGVGFFYILLPGYWAARLGVIILFGIGQYALLLTANIFSVAAFRTIALLRAASAVGFVMTILTGFLLFDTILSFRQPPWINMVTVGMAAGLLLLGALWSVGLEEKLNRQVVTYSLWLAGLLGLWAGVISLWPVTVAVSSLFLTTMLYVYLGISQHHFSQRLVKRTVWEYVTVGMVVLATMLITAGV